MANSKSFQEINRFHSISEFKTSMLCGAEVVFEWQGKEYGIWSENDRIRLTFANEQIEEKTFDDVDDLLEFKLGEDRLRDIITQVTIIDRTI